MGSNAPEDLGGDGAVNKGWKWAVDKALEIISILRIPGQKLVLATPLHDEKKGINKASKLCGYESVGGRIGMQ